MSLDINYLFLSFDGRINRAKWWAGFIALMVVWLIVNAIFGNSTLGAILVILVTLALFYPSYALCAKRFQDRDKPGQTALYGLVAVLIASLLEAVGFTGTRQEPNALGWICNVIYLGVLIWFVVELGILRGTIGSNRYGPDPLAEQ